MSKQQLGPNQRKWIEALRSGEFKQGRNVLCDANDMHCCLGVGCKVAGIAYVETTAEVDMGGDDDDTEEVECLSFDGRAISAPPSLIDWLALRSPAGEIVGPRLDGETYLASANDAGTLFSTIADFIEAHPEAVFTEPR